MPTVLVVDDDRVTTDIFGRMLTLEGYRVLRAYSGEEGLHKASVNPPDLVVLDLRMPLMDGLDMLVQLRAVPALMTVPVVIVTGDYMVDDDTIDKLRAFGATIHYKPLWLDDLMTIVETHVGVMSHK